MLETKTNKYECLKEVAYLQQKISKDKKNVLKIF